MIPSGDSLFAFSSFVWRAELDIVSTPLIRPLADLSLVLTLPATNLPYTDLGENYSACTQPIIYKVIFWTYLLGY